jgi:hypothetical protein
MAVFEHWTYELGVNKGCYIGAEKNWAGSEYFVQLQIKLYEKL